ncbi:hypothetical protein H5410_006315 [Solanum commersonii]|uniref:HXXXD-type acyl-transferase family protein n=1 Tax=Solanum commersonii TaxID=4109 RepID=A0A9J6A9D4_SOLCO|nr:hypothetical protein H5410_006315 [Solanum commersonii]
MASKVSIMSTWTVKAAGQSQINQEHDNCKIIELTPWDILELQIEYGQGGVLCYMPTSQQVRDITNTSSLIDHLRVSLSRVLDFFPPLCGRFKAEEQSGTATCFFINCNNAGVQFSHAKADGVTVDDILDQSKCVPNVVGDFFPLNGVRNIEATSKPFLGVQVTELVDGIFIGCTANHALLDGSSFWHFFSSWAEISSGSNNVISKIPFLKRDEFPFKINNFSNRISIPNERINSYSNSTRDPTVLQQKIFHFTKESIAKLKSKANVEMNTTKISSLQAVLAHIWQSVIRCRNLDRNEETTFEVPIDMRKRLNPPLPEGFFGNAIYPATLTVKTGELLEHGGFEWAALQINEMIASHDHEKFKCIYETWMKDPEVLKIGDLPGNYFMLHNSPRFNFNKYDFGWGKPIAQRGGVSNMMEGKIDVSPGLEEGSMIFDISLSPNTIQALEEHKMFVAVE